MNPEPVLAGGFRERAGPEDEHSAGGGLWGTSELRSFLSPQAPSTWSSTPVGITMCGGKSPPPCTTSSWASSGSTRWVRGQVLPGSGGLEEHCPPRAHAAATVGGCASLAGMGTASWSSSWLFPRPAGAGGGRCGGQPLVLLCPVVVCACTPTNASSVSPCCGSVSFIQSGEIEIVNHKSKDKCQLKFTPYSYFSRDVPRKVSIQR